MSFGELQNAEIGHEDTKKLVNARRLEGRWGGVEFKFPMLRSPHSRTSSPASLLREPAR
ncbi:MAG: hypothetical protein L0220_35640 [Acidobacteria bacterium]|nr:hypothetical protein [Acidobacteriota bacterium]